MAENGPEIRRGDNCKCISIRINHHFLGLVKLIFKAEYKRIFVSLEATVTLPTLFGESAENISMFRLDYDESARRLIALTMKSVGCEAVVNRFIDEPFVSDLEAA